MLAPEDENHNEVRREDQNNINRFAQLNARLHRLRQERQSYLKAVEGLDDASTELVLMDNDGEEGDQPVWLLSGDCFLATSQDEAVAYCEAQVQIVQGKLDALAQEEEDILSQQAELKKILYSRFGKSINLEE